MTHAMIREMASSIKNHSTDVLGEWCAKRIVCWRNGMLEEWCAGLVEEMKAKGKDRKREKG
jgi:hypothetical protein